MFDIEINPLVPLASETAEQEWRADRWHQVIAWVLADGGWRRAEISIAVVDDQQMRELNNRYLQHDYTTDVLSFRLDDDSEPTDESVLEGELIVCRDTARRAAEECEWDTADELLLYVLHGTLHLVGHDDADDEGRRQMRRAELQYLARLDEQLRQNYARSLEAKNEEKE